MLKRSKFSCRFENIPKSIWGYISTIEELKGQWIGGAKFSPKVLNRLKRSVLVTSAGASTRIEGAELDDRAVEQLIGGLKMQKFAMRDKQEVQGYYETLSNIFDSWESIKLSENVLKHLHQELLKYVDKDERHRGEYKKGENKVIAKDEEGKTVAVVFEPTPAYLVPKETQELIDWVNEELESKELHPLLVIANFLVEFLKIHPFQDGNGRLSRLLTNLLLLKQGYEYMPYVSHEKLIEDNKSDYYVALRRSQTSFNTKEETIIPWLEFFFKILLKQSESAIGLLSGENIEKLLSPNQLSVWEYLVKNKQASVGDVVKNTGTARATAKQAIEKLLQLKKIERIGEGRATSYRVV